MEKSINKVAKKALYEFKKFARKKGIWEEYKKLSRSIKEGVFVEKLNTMEPVMIIQNSVIFCIWPSDTGHIWLQLSKEWASFCLENCLYHDENVAKCYCRQFIGVYTD